MNSNNIHFVTVPFCLANHNNILVNYKNLPLEVIYITFIDMIYQ
ncbi:MAG: hypothetical protein K0S41_73 [Anaerocolumna sp.]|jgi:hypothetical protein|nr:hypothetical protein [Anaerocolumna sp.]